MADCIVRGRTVFTRVVDRHTAATVEDGAVLVQDGLVRAVGPFEEARAAHPSLTVHGTGREVVLPSFVNGHHHVGLTPVQLGSPDMPLELWFVTRMVCRAVDLYLDTLYSAFEMIASGCTTVQHIHGWLPGKLDKVMAGANEVIRACDDVGMRMSYSFALRDQNRLVYMDDAEFVASLPQELRPPMERHFARFGMDVDDFMGMFDALTQQHHNKDRVGIELAPANLHWCSDAALERLADASERTDTPMHMHLLETQYQKEYARRRGGGTAVEYIDRFKMLGPRMTLGHGVWLSERDIERIAETGTNICHNCSSNFRLRSGVGPLNVWEAHGVNTAMGMDEAGINDDRDMLQEMRMVLNAHRTPGTDDGVPTMAQVLRMATSGGAATTAFRGRIGTLEPSRPAVPRLGNAGAGRRPATGQDRGGHDDDVRRRGHLSERALHQGRPRRRAGAPAPGPHASPHRRGGRASGPVETPHAPRRGVLRQVCRRRGARAILRAKRAPLMALNLQDRAVSLAAVSEVP
ncbi:amidohydrolase family protein [Acuticoccus sp.]|uniref:amidohydrolase family protein n=1 Tax=Acuticoccus sp. TaxID=1904378 RepID=UPI003B52E48D